MVGAPASCLADPCVSPRRGLATALLGISCNPCATCRALTTKWQSIPSDGIDCHFVVSARQVAQGLQEMPRSAVANPRLGDTHGSARHEAGAPTIAALAADAPTVPALRAKPEALDSLAGEGGYSDAEIFAL